jgi:pimeloyl-ACP methyl ester carboxylesterase
MAWGNHEEVQMRCVFHAGIVSCVRELALLSVCFGAVGCAAGVEEDAAEDEGDAAVAAWSAELSSVPRLSWQACGEDFPGAECAIARVPLDYDRPTRGHTAIALARIPAANPARKVGSVFLNPGGPGSSGVGLVLGGFGDGLAGLLGGRFDVVGFDPRGVGSSEPLHCFESSEALEEFLSVTPVFPYQRESQRPFFAHHRSLAEHCLGDRPRIAAHMSTADVARDLDLLRRAVGDSRLTYLGFSYGSYLGMTYANLFPDKIRALVIDGVLDPRLWSSGWQIVSDREATDQEFAEFLRLCDEAADSCALSGPAGAAARYRALAEAIYAAPLDLGDGFFYSFDYLVADTLTAMYAPESWGGEEGYGALFALLGDIVLGEFELAPSATALREALRLRLNDSALTPAYDNSYDAYYGNHCADAQYPRSFAEFRSVGAYAEHDSLFGPFWWWGNASCSDWPVAPDRYTGPFSTRTSAPALVVGNYFDGITDYAGAIASSKLLRNSRLLSYAGWGHTAFGRSACVTQHVAAYLLDGRLPPAGTVCPANPNPFIPVAELRTSGTSLPLVGLPPPWLTRR